MSFKTSMKPPLTAGDLGLKTTVWISPSKSHYECFHIRSDCPQFRGGRSVNAAVLFHDTRICEHCRRYQTTLEEWDR